jgi:hypothetical protein
MRRLLLGLALVSLVAASTGCQGPACRGCRHAYGKGDLCGGHGLVARHGHGGGVLPGGGAHYRPATEPAGGPAGQYAYPYYTLRGPRDYLIDDPPSIGPY